ncbi:MAG: shikimate kinase [Candidatus Levybacteria bacterium]|nr:shikimate kinase [Candidatus Levybacteria bacterium]
MNIMLIGMRGSGKTTVGKILAKILKKDFIETDKLIGEKAKMSIPKIIEKHGWDFFRNIESEVVQEVAEKDNIVIATGGGVVVSPKNIALLKKSGKLFWLTVSVPTLLKRIGNDKNRPSLTGKLRKEDMEVTLQERQKLYENAADVVVDTEHVSAQKVAEAILTDLEDTYVY